MAIAITSAGRTVDRAQTPTATMAHSAASTMAIALPWAAAKEDIPFITETIQAGCPSVAAKISAMALGSRFAGCSR
jgi:hypothetical protein